MVCAPSCPFRTVFRKELRELEEGFEVLRLERDEYYEMGKELGAVDITSRPPRVA